MSNVNKQENIHPQPVKIFPANNLSVDIDSRLQLYNKLHANNLLLRSTRSKLRRKNYPIWT